MEVFTLGNGLRIVAVCNPSQAELCGLAVDAGTRDEPEQRFGLAHFVEHTLFKGTLHRRAAHINQRMEAVGGELNAYTTKEETFIYSVFPAGHLRRATDLIADLVMYPSFPEAEVERERDVVADEINSYLDIPSEGIFDDFEDRIYAGSDAGHNILGTIESVASLNSAMCREWVKTRFTPGRMVFFYAGPMEGTKVARVAERCFAGLGHADLVPERRCPAVVAPFTDTVVIHCHQAHTVTGARIDGYGSPRSAAISLATNILGGPGMNSLLNVALREKRGLVYTIDAATSLLSNAGLFTVYYGCDVKDLQRCRRLVADVIERLADNGLTPRQLDAAKRQLLGQITVANANAETAVTAKARQLLHLGRVTDSRETVERIEAVSHNDLREVLDMLRPAMCSTLTLR